MSKELKEHSLKQIHKNCSKIVYEFVKQSLQPNKEQLREEIISELNEYNKFIEVKEEFEFYENEIFVMFSDGNVNIKYYKDTKMINHGDFYYGLKPEINLKLALFFQTIKRGE